MDEGKRARPDYYAVLQVPRDASEAEIKRAYRRLALLLHPDVQPDEPRAAERFRALAEAYSVVGDPVKRPFYDASLASPEAPRVVPANEYVANSLGGLLDGLFGVRDRRARTGRDRKYALAVSFAEMSRGASKTLSLPHDVPCEVCEARGFEPGTVPLICPTCEGGGALVKRGALRSSLEECSGCVGRGYTCPEPCLVCRGSGEVAQTQSVRIQVPSGVKDGKVLVLRGLGEPGRNGGRAGDCVVVIELREHPLLVRDGLDVRLDRPVSVLTAVTGGKIDVPTPVGRATVTLPGGATEGLVLRMRGFGITDPKTGQTGDQLVTIRLEMPTSLDDPQVTAIQKLAADLRARSGVFPETAAFERTLEQIGD